MLQWLYDYLQWGAAPAAPARAHVVPPAHPGGAAAPAAAHVPAAAPIPAVPMPAPPVAMVVPPPIPFPVVRAPIMPDVERRQRDVAEFLAQIGPREQAVGGHVVARHHPRLTDQQLQARLTTGLDADGDVAVNSGISSAFASEELFAATLRRVEDMLNTGLESTRAYLRANLDDYKTTRRDAEAAQLAALPLTLGAANPIIKAHHQAKQDLIAAIGATQQAQVVRGAFMLPVEPFEVPPLPNRHNWPAVLQRLVVVRLYPAYCLTAYQHGQVGRGFRGTQPKQAVVQGTQMTLYKVVQPFQGPSDHTFTKLRVTGQHDLRIDRPHNARAWGVTTHFPTDSRVESIQPA
jgi:hypothetical protein